MMPSHTPIHALIFDMDGTMVDSMPYHQQTWVVFAAQHGVQMGIEEIMRRTTGRNGVECMRELLGQSLSQEEAQRLVLEKEQLYRRLFAPVFTEVAGFGAFFAQAQARGLKLGVGTAGDKHNIAFVLEHLKLNTQGAPLVCVGGDEGLPGKPDPAIFLEVARRLNVAPEHCVVFEDAPFGIEAARRAGMRAVAICTTHSPAELAGEHVLASGADYVGLMAGGWLGGAE